MTRTGWLGLRVRPKRSRSGRVWVVWQHEARIDEFWLRPVGDDVQSARSGTTGRWQGGVRSIRRSGEELRRGWEEVR